MLADLQAEITRNRQLITGYERTLTGAPIIRAIERDILTAEAAIGTCCCTDQCAALARLQRNQWNRRIL